MTDGATAGSTPIYRGMDRQTLDAAYNNSSAVADSAQRVQAWRETSAAVRAKPDSRLDLRYGPRSRQRLDFFPTTAANAPLFVFIHGGYWQRNEKETFAFVAEGPRGRRINVALPGYTLAPEASLTDIVAEIRLALDFLAARSSELGFDAARIVVGGWSAGGHLTASVANHAAVHGGLPISGIFDLEPIALTYLNHKLQLSAGEIASLSPLRNLSASLPPLCVAVGGAELPELRRQSKEYAAAAQASGVAVEFMELAGHHHFSILDELAHSDGALTRALEKLTAA
jgi:arylformamidase